MGVKLAMGHHDKDRRVASWPTFANMNDQMLKLAESFMLVKKMSENGENYQWMFPR